MGRRGLTVPLPHIDRFRDRHGRIRYYYRRPGHKRVPLPDLADPGFRAAYDAAAAAAPPLPPKAKVRGAPGTFERLATEYFAASDFTALKPSSQAVTRGILEAFLQQHGHRLVAQMERRHVAAIIGRMADRPAAANNLLKKLRRLIGFAIANGWRSDDPTISITKFREGTFHTWTEAELGAFEARWPLGSRERTAYALALFTGQRRGDTARITWRDYDAAAGTIEVVQEKTDMAGRGEKLVIPAHRQLRAALAAWRAREPVIASASRVIIVTGRGQPFSVAGFGNMMADAIAAAGLPERCVLHGLRKAAARRLAEAGCSAKEIAAITGHRSLDEVERYTRAADQKRLARAAVTRLPERFGDTDSQTSPGLGISAPDLASKSDT